MKDQKQKLLETQWMSYVYLKTDYSCHDHGHELGYLRPGFDSYHQSASSFPLFDSQSII